MGARPGRADSGVEGDRYHVDSRESQTRTVPPVRDAGYCGQVHFVEVDKRMSKWYNPAVITVMNI